MFVETPRRRVCWWNSKILIWGNQRRIHYETWCGSFHTRLFPNFFHILDL